MNNPIRCDVCNRAEEETKLTYIKEGQWEQAYLCDECIDELITKKDERIDIDESNNFWKPILKDEVEA